SGPRSAPRLRRPGTGGNGAWRRLRVRLWAPDWDSRRCAGVDATPGLTCGRVGTGNIAGAARWRHEAIPAKLPASRTETDDGRRRGAPQVVAGGGSGGAGVAGGLGRGPAAWSRTARLRGRQWAAGTERGRHRTRGGALAGAGGRGDLRAGARTPGHGRRPGRTRGRAGGAARTRPGGPPRRGAGRA